MWFCPNILHGFLKIYKQGQYIITITQAHYKPF